MKNEGSLLCSQEKGYRDCGTAPVKKKKKLRAYPWGLNRQEDKMAASSKCPQHYKSVPDYIWEMPPTGLRAPVFVPASDPSCSPYISSMLRPNPTCGKELFFINELQEAECGTALQEEKTINITTGYFRSTPLYISS